MAIFIGFLTVLLAIVSILLILLVLLQDDGAEGAGLLFGSSVSQQYGARKGNVITRTTSILAVSFIIIALVLAFLFRENEVDVTSLESTVNDAQPTTVEWWNENATESSTEPETGSIVAPSETTEQALPSGEVKQDTQTIQTTQTTKDSPDTTTISPSPEN